MEIGNNSVAAQRQPLSLFRKHLLSEPDANDVPYWVSVCSDDMRLTLLLWLLIVTLHVYLCWMSLCFHFDLFTPVKLDARIISLGTSAHLLLSMHWNVASRDFYHCLHLYIISLDSSSHFMVKGVDVWDTWKRTMLVKPQRLLQLAGW